MTVDEIVQRVRERSRRLAAGLPVLQPPLGSVFPLNGVVPLTGDFSGPLQFSCHWCAASRA